MIKLVLVDDHALFLEGLASILRLDPEIEITGMAGSVEEAVEVVQNIKPEIVLMDFTLPDGTGADATRRILEKHPECKIVFLTMSESDENLFSAIRSGATGYLLKNMSPSKLVTAIKAVQRGESAVSRTMTLRLMEELSRTEKPDQFRDSQFETLTQRELEVLRELAKGLTNREISEQVFISQNTVKYHVHSILDKLNLPNRGEAAKFAKKNGLTD